MRIGLIFLLKNTKKQQHAHPKSVARLVETEKWSEKNPNKKKQQYAHRTSVARLVDSENW